MANNNSVNKLKSEHKALLLMVGGVLIELYAFNFFARWLTSVVIIVGIVMILSGIMKLKGNRKIEEIFKK